MDLASKDIWKKIAIEDLPISDILSMCRLDRAFNQMCSDNNFWKQVYFYNFSPFYPKEDVNWKKLVKEEWKRKRKQIVQKLFDTVREDFPDASFDYQRQRIYLDMLHFSGPTGHSFYGRFVRTKKQIDDKIFSFISKYRRMFPNIEIDYTVKNYIGIGYDSVIMTYHFK